MDKPLKILFLTDNFPPEVNAPAIRTFEHCEEWKKAGEDIKVITGAPNFPHGKVFDGYKNKLRHKEVYKGVKVTRVWTYINANEGFFKRIIDYISFAFSAFWASLFIKSDIIVATSPQFFTAVGGYFAAVVKRKPWIMEVRDLWPESIAAVGAMNESSITFRLLEKIELFLYRKATKIVVVTDAFKSNMIRRGISSEKIHVVKNGVHLDKFKPLPKEEPLVQLYGLRDKFVIGYLGTHGLAHKLDFILNCAANPELPKHIHFLFIGGGAEKEKLVKLKEKLNLSNVTMLSPVPKEDIHKYISITDAALVPLKKSDTFKTVIPSKIFENAAMHKPILLGVEGESKAIIEQYRAGLCFEPENESEFIQSVITLCEDEGIYKKCQIGCENLAIDFDRKKLANQLLQLIGDCTGKSIVKNENLELNIAPAYKESKFHHEQQQ